MNRRAFTFASLALAGTAAAADTLPDVKNDAPPSPLTGTWALKASHRELVVDLSVVNASADGLDVLVARGSRPGPSVQAFISAKDEEIELQPVEEAVDRREAMSRMGPRPLYTLVAAGATAKVGPWKFALPRGAAHETFRVVATVSTSEGDFALETTSAAGAALAS
jgi:hypothetical protein